MSLFELDKCNAYDLDSVWGNSNKQYRLSNAMKRCTSCGQVKTEYEFSKSQLKSKTRRCKQCVGPTTPTGPATAMCSSCGVMKVKTQFTKSQWSNNLQKRKCLQCSETARMANSGQQNLMSDGTATAVCVACQVRKPKTQFTKKQWKANLSKRKCMQCTNANQPRAPNPGPQNIFKQNEEEEKKAWLNNPATQAKLQGLRQALDETKKYLQQCAAAINNVTSQEIITLLSAVEKLFQIIFGVRDIDVTQKDFEFLTNTLLLFPGFKDNQEATMSFNVTLQVRKMVQMNPQSDMGLEQHKMILETVNQMLYYLEGSMLDLLCSSIMKKKSPPPAKQQKKKEETGKLFNFQLD